MLQLHCISFDIFVHMQIESLVAASAVQEKALSDLLGAVRCSDTAVGVTQQHITDSTKVYNLAECFSRLSIIRSQTSACGSALNQFKDPNQSEFLKERKKTLLFALTQLDSIKTFCENVSDGVFRSLCGAKKEGGHALLSARCRSLSLPGRIRVISHTHTASGGEAMTSAVIGTGVVIEVGTGAGIRKAAEGEGRSRGGGGGGGSVGLSAISSCTSKDFTIGSSNDNNNTTLRYKDLLLMSRELREVQKIVKKSLVEVDAALHTSSLKTEHKVAAAAVLLTSAESFSLSDSIPCSPTSRNARDLEEKQWVDRCP